MNDTDFNWLAGLLEGEGSFLTGPPSRPHSPIISLQMTDEDIVARVAKMFGVRYHRATTKMAHYRPSFTLAKKGFDAVEWMQQLRPLMGKRRQAQIDVALACWDPRFGKKRLNRQQQEEIRERLKAGENYLLLAKEYGTNRSTIYNVKNQKHAYAPVV